MRNKLNKFLNSKYFPLSFIVTSSAITLTLSGTAIYALVKGEYLKAMVDGLVISYGGFITHQMIRTYRKAYVLKEDKTDEKA